MRILYPWGPHDVLHEIPNSTLRLQCCSSCTIIPSLARSALSDGVLVSSSGSKSIIVHSEMTVGDSTYRQPTEPTIWFTLQEGCTASNCHLHRTHQELFTARHRHLRRQLGQTSHSLQRAWNYVWIGENTTFIFFVSMYSLPSILASEIKPSRLCYGPP